MYALEREFLATVSHELRTPLSYVKGYTEALMDGVADSQDKKERYLSTIHNETERMERLVNGLLELAKLERGTYPIKKEKIELEGIATKVVDRYQDAYNEKGISLSYLNKAASPIWMNTPSKSISLVLPVLRLTNTAALTLTSPLTSLSSVFHIISTPFAIKSFTSTSSALS